LRGRARFTQSQRRGQGIIPQPLIGWRGLAASAVGQTSATLSWTASSDNVAVTGYRLYRDGTQVGAAAATNFD